MHAGSNLCNGWLGLHRMSKFILMQKIHISLNQIVGCLHGLPAYSTLDYGKPGSLLNPLLEQQPIVAFRVLGFIRVKEL